MSKDTGAQLKELMKPPRSKLRGIAAKRAEDSQQSYGE